MRLADLARLAGVAELVARRPRTVLVAALVVTALAVLPASQVRFHTDLPSLLPAGSPAAADYRIFLERFGGFEKVFVLIQLADSEAVDPDSDPEQQASDLIEAAAVLAELLATNPEVASVRSGIEPEDEAFFFDYVVPRAPLLLDRGWQTAVRERLAPAAISGQVAEIRATIMSPAGSFKAPFLTGDPLGFGEALAGTRDFSSSVPIDPLSLSFLSPGGETSLVILTPARAEIDPAGGRALMAALDDAFVKVEQELGLSLSCHALGGPLYAAQDEAILRHDLSRTVTGSLLGCAIVLVAAFEGLLIPIAALLALTCGLLWTGAWIGLSVGQISAVGLGFAAVLVGLGIDYGIHGGARFRQSLLELGDRCAAMVATFRHTGPGIITSALTTATAFAVLGFAHFRPLRELGLVVAIGIISILLASATAGAALLVLFGSAGKRRPGLLWRLLGATVEHLVELAVRRPRLVLISSVLLSVLAVLGLSRLSLDPDLRAMRPADHPALAAEQLLAERFGLGLDTVTVLVPGQDLDQALIRGREVERLLRVATPAAAITSPGQWLTSRAEVRERLEALAELPFAEAAQTLRQALPEAGLNPKAFAHGLNALAAFADGRDPGAPARAVWPAWLAELIREHPDQTWIALRLRLPPSVWPDGPPAELVARIKQIAPGSAVASAVAVGAELRTVAGQDVTRLSLIALVLVVLVVTLSFRGRLLESGLAATPVILGSLWLLGLWGGLGRSIDLISLAVLPIMLGIGIDDGLHALHGAGRDGVAGIRGSVVAAGRAMALTTLTTCVGFGSLTLSQVPGLRNGGLLVAIGVLACLLATLLVLPALAVFATSLRRPRQS